MKQTLPLIALLASCAGSATMKPDGSVTVTGPVMARADRLAVNVKTQVGEMRFMMVNGNSESVPNTAIQAAGAAALAGFSVSAKKSDNALSATQNTNSTKQAISAGEQATRQAEISAKAGVTSEAIKSGAEITPITISPP